MSAWGGITIPNPSTQTWQADMVGAEAETLDGVVTDLYSTRWRISLAWDDITTAEKNSLRTLANTYTAQVLAIDGLDTATVTPVLNSLSIEQIPGTGVGAIRWNMRCEVRTE